MENIKPIIKNDDKVITWIDNVGQYLNMSKERKIERDFAEALENFP